ncbi:MAG: winged helix-turn-helix transcriptional regulator [Pseudohaliea sp.]
MAGFTGYGQFCPVAKASEILAKRWTPLIVRELLSGSAGFNEIHRGVPLMSRPLLSRRLRELTGEGVVQHTAAGIYQLTEAGHALEPVIRAMGLWGQRWVESEINGSDWDAGVLMWDMRRRIDTDALPAGRTVLQFDFRDAPEEMRWWWLLIQGGEVDLCVSDPGYEVDLFVITRVRVLGPIWIGKRALAPALERDELRLHGRVDLASSISRWLMLSTLAE